MEESSICHTCGNLRGTGKPAALVTKIKGAHKKRPGHHLALEKFGLARGSLLMDSRGWGGRRSEAWPMDTPENGEGY